VQKKSGTREAVERAKDTFLFFPLRYWFSGKVPPLPRPSFPKILLVVWWGEKVGERSYLAVALHHFSTAQARASMGWKVKGESNLYYLIGVGGIFLVELEAKWVYLVYSSGKKHLHSLLVVTLLSLQLPCFLFTHFSFSLRSNGNLNSLRISMKCCKNVKIEVPFFCKIGL